MTEAMGTIKTEAPARIRAGAAVSLKRRGSSCTVQQFARLGGGAP